jgi:uncharacterized membrane protein
MKFGTPDGGNSGGVVASLAGLDTVRGIAHFAVSAGNDDCANTAPAIVGQNSSRAGRFVVGVGMHSQQDGVINHQPLFRYKPSV